MTDLVTVTNGTLQAVLVEPRTAIVTNSKSEVLFELPMAKIVSSALNEAAVTVHAPIEITGAEIQVLVPLPLVSPNRPRRSFSAAYF